MIGEHRKDRHQLRGPRLLLGLPRHDGLMGRGTVDRRRAWLKWGFVVVLAAGALLFAHWGCHGDEDTELLARLGLLGRIGSSATTP